MGYHYNPQKYLEGFGVPHRPGYIWQFDKQAGVFSGGKSLPIKDVAQEPRFYDAETEKELARLVESPANPVLDKLRSHDFALSSEERLRLAWYIATMMKRVPRSRERARELAPKVLAELCEEVRDQIRAAANAKTLNSARADAYLADLDSLEPKFSANPPPEAVAVINNPWPRLDNVMLVAAMQWRFVVTDDRYFLTSDNPAYYFDVWGVSGSPEAEVTFPISSTVALFGSWEPLYRPSSQIVKNDAQIVKQANNRLASGASRFVFCRAKAPWIATIAHKPTERMIRIRWAGVDREQRREITWA